MDTSNSSTSVINVAPQGPPVPRRRRRPTAAAPGGKAKVAVTPFQRATEAGLIVLTGYLVGGMTGNPVYTSPNPKLADFVTTRNEFIAAVDAAKGNTIAVAVRRQKRTALVGARAHACALRAGNERGRSSDPAQLGLHRAAQPPAHRQAVCTAEPAARARQGHRGDRRALQEARPGGRVRVALRHHERAQHLDAWRHHPRCEDHAHRLLEPGTQYIVQVRAVGTAGASDWSDAATLMAA